MKYILVSLLFVFSLTGVDPSFDLVQGKWEGKAPLKIEYNPQGKVKDLYLEENQFHFEYEDRFTTCLDGRGVLRRYHYNRFHQIEKIEIEVQGELYQIEELEWASDSLIRRTFKTGDNTLLSQQRWVYDDRKNLVEEYFEGTLTSEEAPFESHKRTYRYDRQNRLIEEEEEEGLKISYEYSNDERSLKVVWDGENIVERTYYFYDDKKLIKTIIDDGYQTCTFEKITHHHPIEMIKGLVNSSTGEELIQERTHLFFNEHNQLIKQCNLEDEISTTYAEDGSIKEVISKNHQLVVSPDEVHFYGPDSEKISTYSKQKKIKEEVIKNGSPFSSCFYRYDPFGHLVEKIENGSCITQYQFDALGRKIKEILPDGAEIIFTYDPLNRVISEENPEEVIYTTYNARGQPFRIDHEKREYTLGGRLAKRTYEDGTYETYRYDRLGRVTKESFFSQEEHCIHSKETIYSGAQILKEIFSSGITVQHTYNSWGLKEKSICKETGRKVTFHYNEKGELTDQKKEAPGIIEEEGHIELAINASGQTVWKKTRENVVTWYDVLKRPAQVETYLPSGQIESVIYLQYDFKGRKIEEIIEQPLEKSTIINRFSYDPQGNLVYLIEGAGSRIEKITSYTYNKRGKITSETHSSGICIEYEYDSAGRLKQVKSNDTTIHYLLHYNQEGRVACVEDLIHQLKNLRIYDLEGQVLTETLANGLTLQNSYDELGRRTQLTLPDLSTIQFEFEEQKSLVTKSEGRPTKPTVNEDNLEYDLAGNLIKKISNGIVFSFKYDAFNRLIEVKKDGEVIHTYIYDLYHRRLADGELKYLYDGNLEIGTMSGKTIQELRIFNGNGTCIAFKLHQKAYTPTYDSLGSVASLIDDETGQVVANYRYTAFGEASFEGTVESPWQYFNKRKDPYSDLIHFGRRDYDPTLGRFMTQDPMGFIDGPDRYMFCHNDPLNFKDPFGLQADLSGWDQFKQDALDFFQSLGNTILSYFQSMKEHSNLSLSTVFENVMGNGFILLTGYHSTKEFAGHHGKGEVSDKVRVSFINGILTTETGLLSTLQELSESHGNVNVHYVYRPTKGWVKDILYAFAVTLGVVSPEAHMLAALWRQMVDEMGGIDGGGKIIHYAHSIGAVETARALALLTEEEQKLIHIYAFGSPSLNENNPYQQTHHFVSIRDGVPLLNLPAFIRASQGDIPHVIFTGSAFGFPFVDHLFRDQTYLDIWKSMGRTFSDWYGSL